MVEVKREEVRARESGEGLSGDWKRIWRPGLSLEAWA
jgi:hypothetical protein